jgi:replicative DNA helicase
MVVPLTSLNFALDTQQVVGFERALLGTLLAYSNLFQKAEELLPSDFVDPGHQAIFSQMLALYRQDQLSARAVVENIRARETLNAEEMRFNGEGYIEELTTYASAPSIDNFVDNVIKASMRRQILNASALMAADANQYNIDPDDILDQTEERIMNLRRRKTTEGVDAGNLMDMFETQMNARLDGSYVPALYPKIYALQELLGAYEDQDFPIVAARPGDGKCLGRGTKVVMFDGSLINVEDVRANDLLMGPDSLPRKVVSTTTGRAMMYWVRQNRAMDYRVNEHHILSLKRSKNEWSRTHGEIRNFSIREWIEGRPSWANRWKGYKVSIELPERVVPLEPYFLGLWLGDGHSSASTITSVDQDVIDYLRDYAMRRGEYLHSHNLAHRISRPKPGNNARDGQTVQGLLRRLNLLNNKHIPDMYLRNAKYIRWAVLAGLIDSDGHLIHNGIEIVQKNKNLAQDIKFLADTLGLRTSPLYQRQVTCQTGATSTVYRLTIHGDFTDCPIRISRKIPDISTSRVDWQMTGIRVEQDKVDDYFGFTLEGDGLFLLEDMTVTHNSSYMRWEAYKEAQSGRRVAIVNLENSETEYARWMVAMHTQIDAELLRHPRSLSPDQLQAVRDAIADLRGMPLKIITLGSPSAQEVMRALLPEVRAGAKSMWVDYIQKMYNGIDNRVNDISISSSLLRGFALKHHVVVGCGAQLSRSIIARGENAEPEQSDLRESGSLEQEATHILFPRKLWARPTDQDLRQFPENRDGRVRVIPVHFYIKKNRNGPEGVSGHIIWKKHINHYETLETN